MATPLVEFRDLKVHFPVYKGFVQRLLGGGDVRVHAVDGVTFSVREGEVFGLVGESGCGKSTIARTLVGLAKPTGGEFLFRGTDVALGARRTLARSRERVHRLFRLLETGGFGKSKVARALAGAARAAARRLGSLGVRFGAPEGWTLFRLREQIQMIHQDPHAALSPAMTVGEAIADVIRTHGIRTEDGGRIRSPTEPQIREAVFRALENVELRPPKFFYSKYPDELSGGQNQRVVVGRVLALRPELVVADEPLAMLDMSVRARMLEFLLDLKARFGLTYVFITHDLATAKFVCDRIGIMYLGRIVEAGPARTIYADPKHPYTRALLDAIPVPDPSKRRPKSLPRGEVPDAVRPPAGCRFHPRCPVALPSCGWEGQDLRDFLAERWLSEERAEAEAELGPLEAWQAEGREVRRKLGNVAPEALVSKVRGAIGDAPRPLAEAVESVAVEDGELVVRFRPPDVLEPREVAGRTVECLLY